MGQGQEERRRAVRYAVELRVEFKHLGRPLDTYADITRDISEGGVFVDSTVGLEVGTEVALEISPSPGTPPIRMHAEVVRVEEEPGQTGSKATSRARGMALRFKETDAATGELARLINLAKQMQISNAQSSPKSPKKR
jgi:hypothetical protein